MDITQKGKDTASSPEFTEELQAVARRLQTHGLPEEQRTAVLISFIAFVLMDKTADEVSGDELEHFIDNYVAEINQVFSRALWNLMQTSGAQDSTIH
jgi:hypothetical protein